MKAIGYYLTVLGGVLSHPGAFIAAIAFTIAWVIVQPESFDWHGGVTIATLFMTLFIQRATHRDTQALHAKIDELIHTSAHARNSVANVDDKEPEEIEDHREQERK